MEYFCPYCHELLRMPEAVEVTQARCPKCGVAAELAKVQAVPSASAEKGLAEKVYSVPSRVGISTLMVATAAFSVLFAVLRWLNVEPELYGFLMFFIFAVCVSQMVFPRRPRRASMICGAIVLSLCIAVIEVFSYGLWPFKSPFLISFLVCFFPTSIVIGAALGYLVGGLAATFFLVADLWKKGKNF